MKTKIKTWISLLLLLGFLTTVLISCTKKEDTPDYATAIAGTYTGTLTVVGTGSATASSTLSKSTETLVDLLVSIGARYTTLSGINVSNPSSNNYTLSYTDASGSFTGKVQGNILTWTITDGTSVDTFTGTK
jgi:hypothetical protein